MSTGHGDINLGGRAFPLPGHPTSRWRCRVDRAVRVGPGALYPEGVMDERETMNVGLGRTSLVVAASDGPGG